MNQPAKGSFPANFTVEYSKAVLESLVEQGPGFIKRDAWLVCAHSEPLVPALVEVAKATLKAHHEATVGVGPDSPFVSMAIAKIADEFVAGQAQAVAPRMLEAGMTLPEAPSAR